MSDPAEPRRPEHARYRYPGQLTEEEAAEMQRSRVVDAEPYIDWLENGDGPDPWDASSV